MRTRPQSHCTGPLCTHQMSRARPSRPFWRAQQQSSCNRVRGLVTQPCAALTGHLQVRLCSQGASSLPAVPKPHVHASLAFAAAQNTLAAAQLPSPGLPAGLLVNSTVFLLGIQILLKGTRCSCAGHLM